MWLNTKQMAVLFDKEESKIRRHITNVFKEGELDRENNVHFLHVNGVKNAYANSRSPNLDGRKGCYGEGGRKPD